MKIGILQTGYAPHDLVEEHGQYSEMFQKLLEGNGFTFETWEVIQSDFPSSTRDADGWLVTGSKYSVYEDLPWIRSLEEFLRNCYDDDVPIVGVCFGHQALATALGGKVAKFEGGWGIGRQEYEFDGSPIFLNAWHQDQVIALPKDAEVTGSSEFCRFAMLAYGNRAISVQAHPEFDHPFIEGLMETRGVGTVPPELLESARHALGEEVEGTRYAGVISTFFRTSGSEDQLQSD